MLLKEHSSGVFRTSTPAAWLLAVMGLFGRLRTEPAPVAAAPVELAAQVVADAVACLRSGADVGRCTLGGGKPEHMPVAGTQHRGPAVNAALAASGGFAIVNTTSAAAVLMREPGNAYDSNAVRVLVAGVHIGYLPATDAKRYQPLLKECEKRDAVLVAALRFLPADDRFGTGAALDVRPSLTGWQHSVALPPPFVSESLPPRVLTGDELDSMI